MPEVQEVCEDVIAAAEGSLACAVIDLTTGTTVAAAYGPDTELNANRIGLVSVAVTDMFRGRLIRQFHRAWSSGNSVPEHFVREVQMATANSYQFISVVPARKDTLLVLITDRTVSLGLGWMSVHQALEQLENVAGPVGAGGAYARRDPTPTKPPADAAPTLHRPRPAAPDAPPAPASRGPKRPPREPGTAVIDAGFRGTRRPTPAHGAATRAGARSASTSGRAFAKNVPRCAGRRGTGIARASGGRGADGASWPDVYRAPGTGQAETLAPSAFLGSADVGRRARLAIGASELRINAIASPRATGSSAHLPR